MRGLGDFAVQLTYSGMLNGVRSEIERQGRSTFPISSSTHEAQSAVRLPADETCRNLLEKSYRPMLMLNPGSSDSETAAALRGGTEGLGGFASVGA